MLPILNRPQSILLAVVGGVIVLAQLSQFERRGVDGFAWVGSFLVGGALFLPIFSTRGKTDKTPRSSASEFHAALAENDTWLQEVETRSVSLARELVKWLPMNATPEFAKLNQFIGKQWVIPSQAYLLALTTVAAYYRDPGFLTSGRSQRLAATTGALMMSTGKTLQHQGIGMELPREAVLELVRGATQAVAMFVGRSLKGITPAEEPLCNFMAEALGVTPDNRAEFDRQLAAYTRRTLSELSLGPACAGNLPRQAVVHTSDAGERYQ